jgi:putative transposase
MEGKLLEGIHQATNKEIALGNEHFFIDVESLTKRRVIERKRVRLVGWRNNKNEDNALN